MDIKNRESLETDKEEQEVSNDISLEDNLAELKERLRKKKEAKKFSSKKKEEKISGEVKNALKDEAKEIKELFSKISEINCRQVVFPKKPGKGLVTS